MATSKGRKKAKPITREELAGLSHKDLASVGTKRRIMAALPSSAKPKTSTPAKPKGAEIPEGTNPRRAARMRIEAGHAAREGRTDGKASE